jgi:DNA-binding MarR family transcriptional regulator
MKAAKELSEREKLVLYGLVRCPGEPDTHIAKELGMPQPTFSNIQRRLKKHGYYQVIGVPDLEILGCEIVGVMYGTYSPLIPIEERKELEAEYRIKHPEIFYMLNGVHKLLTFLTAEDYLSLNKAMEHIENHYMESEMIEKAGLVKTTFALPTALISRWFDYSPALYTKFDLEGKVGLPPTYRTLEDRETEKKKFSASELSKNEARIFIHMLEHPDSSEVEMAMRLKLSRTTVSKAKNHLMDTGLFRRQIVPNLAMIGNEILVFSHTKFTPGTTYKDRIGSTKWLMKNIPVLLSILTNQEAATLYAMESYHALQELKRIALAEYKSKGYMDADPELIVYSMAEIAETAPANFVPIVKKIFRL